jgi:GNAT superfamily N-acetyltransferase
MVRVYSSLPGFPGPDAQPRYYEMLAGVGRLASRPGTALLVALVGDELVGGVVYIADMRHYGAGGAASAESDAAGFRLLAVEPRARGAGVGKRLVEACLARARGAGRRQVVIHTTAAMQVAWELYRKIGFVRAPELDFMQESLEVVGFRLRF